MPESLEHRVRMLEAEFLTARNTQGSPGFRVAKYAEAAVDHLLLKHGCKTLAELDTLITELTAIAIQRDPHA